MACVPGRHRDFGSPRDAQAVSEEAAGVGARHQAGHQRLPSPARHSAQDQPILGEEVRGLSAGYAGRGGVHSQLARFRSPDLRQPRHVHPLDQASTLIAETRCQGFRFLE